MADPRWMSATTQDDGRFDREEALVRRDRPALAYTQDYKLEGEKWEDESTPFARSICRLQTKEGEFIGSGWLLKDSTNVITNHKVVNDFGGKDIYACFRAVPKDPTADAQYIQQVKYVKSHANTDVFDIAVLEFVNPAAAKTMCANLKIEGLVLKPKYKVERGEGVRVIGYSGRPKAQQDKKLLEANFGKNPTYDILRLSAGTVMATSSKDVQRGNVLASRFQHDCSVLNGGEGSPVLNDDFEVIGMHCFARDNTFNDAEYPAGIKEVLEAGPAPPK